MKPQTATLPALIQFPAEISFRTIQPAEVAEI
jgi:hypothetical protein